jgi:hypothetical protein
MTAKATKPKSVTARTESKTFSSDPTELSTRANRTKPHIDVTNTIALNKPVFTTITSLTSVKTI